MTAKQKVPLDASGVLAFTPSCLTETEKPPAFILKTCTRRDREQFEDLLVEARIFYHGQDRIREEVKAGLRQLWSKEAADKEIPRIEAYWEAADEYTDSLKEIGEGEEIPAFEHPDAAHMEELEDRISSAWAPLRRLAVDNHKFNREQPRQLLRVALNSIENCPVPLTVEYGVVSEDSICDLQDWLEKEFGRTKGKLAFLQLYAAALPRMFILEELEKNSKSPSQSTQTQEPIQTDGSAAAKDGKSPESEPSEAILGD